jgi:hypothetical protein
VPVVVADGVAHFANLMRCASVHACPVCSPRIRQRRSEEIRDGLSAWFERGGTALFITGTMPHDYGDRLADLYAAVALGLRSMWSGEAWMRDKEQFGVAGVIRALEVTHGASGWHPHVHALVLVDHSLTASERTRLGWRLAARWGKGIERAGYRRPNDEYGFSCVPVFDLEGVAAYTAKLDGDVTSVGVSLELARPDLKRGRRESRSPWEILGEIEQWGDADDLRLWGEYERASKGKRAVLWSPGLRARLEVGDVTDAEIVEEEIPGEVVAVLSRPQWASVVRFSHGPALILDLAELAGEDGVRVGLVELARGSP